MGTWEHIKLGEIPQNTHWNNEREFVCLHPTNVHHMLLWSLSSSFFGNILEHFLVWTCHKEQESLFAHLLNYAKENRMLLNVVWILAHSDRADLFEDAHFDNPDMH
jgi:hypothetical protein